MYTRRTRRTSGRYRRRVPQPELRRGGRARTNTRSDRDPDEANRGRARASEPTAHRRRSAAAPARARREPEPGRGPCGRNPNGAVRGVRARSVGGDRGRFASVRSSIRSRTRADVGQRRSGIERRRDRLVLSTFGWAKREDGPGHRRDRTGSPAAVGRLARRELACDAFALDAGGARSADRDRHGCSRRSSRR